jgi:hypothetical protein
VVDFGSTFVERKIHRQVFSTLQAALTDARGRLLPEPVPVYFFYTGNLPFLELMK